MPKKSLSLHEAIKTFDRSAIADSVKESEEKRKEIVERFVSVR